eukprot:scaffold272_cov112-Isochrysis_galbana.AAC.5
MYRRDVARSRIAPGCWPAVGLRWPSESLEGLANWGGRVPPSAVSKMPLSLSNSRAVLVNKQVNVHELFMNPCAGGGGGA